MSINIPVIKMDNVFKVYQYRKQKEKKQVHALQGLSLEIKEGEVLGLIGPNGAGKTSAIKILMGLSFPTSGAVDIFGLSPGSKEANRNIGYVAEVAYYYPFLEATTLLRYYARLAGVPGKEIEERILDALELVHLSQHKDRRIGEFSKGMQQRLGIAQALLPAPKLLILDEPTSGLDPIGQHEVLSILARLRNQGLTILLSSHQLPEVEGLCNKVIIIHKGKVLFHGTLSELSRSFISPSSVICYSNKETQQIEIELKIQKEEINTKIDELRKQGCIICSVTPLVPKLNEIFYDMICKANEEESK